MSLDNSPNGMVIKPDPQPGFLGGGISKKVKAVATLLFVSILMIFLPPQEKNAQKTTLQVVTV
ncbi:hypothetical protein ACPV39_22460, partial [Photobacterium damselae]|uniref:hypothetical protein n=1 Tax=Photobacterium damselae TaxID=38293 RepID=UPI004068EC10